MGAARAEQRLGVGDTLHGHCLAAGQRGHRAVAVERVGRVALARRQRDHVEQHLARRGPVEPVDIARARQHPRAIRGVDADVDRLADRDQREPSIVRRGGADRDIAASRRDRELAEREVDRCGLGRAANIARHHATDRAGRRAAPAADTTIAAPGARERTRELDLRDLHVPRSHGERRSARHGGDGRRDRRRGCIRDARVGDRSERRGVTHGSGFLRGSFLRGGGLAIRGTRTRAQAHDECRPPRHRAIDSTNHG